MKARHVTIGASIAGFARARFHHVMAGAGRPSTPCSADAGEDVDAGLPGLHPRQASPGITSLQRPRPCSVRSAPMRHVTLLLAASALGSISAAGSLWATWPPASVLASQAMAQPASGRQPLYYQDPSGAA